MIDIKDVFIIFVRTRSNTFRQFTTRAKNQISYIAFCKLQKCFHGNNRRTIICKGKRDTWLTSLSFHPTSCEYHRVFNKKVTYLISQLKPIFEG